MPFIRLIAVCSEHDVNELCGHDAEFL